MGFWNNLESNQQMMQPLSKHILSQIDANLVVIPEPHLFQLPETVLQFGTGVLLRGLIDQYIHAANIHGDYAGRVVVVKSTDTPGADAFGRQDGLFTEYVRGIVQGVQTEQLIINAAISRVLSAASEWSNILSVAANPQLEIIVSNTTEAGLVYDETDVMVQGKAPRTYPGKLLACLYHRWMTLGAEASGLVILPTELVPQNGAVLKRMVIDLAGVQNLGNAFVQWLMLQNDFCNTLVDRIVPGKVSADEMVAISQTLGYDDALLLVREPFGLWAIETNRSSTKQKLGFAKTPGNNLVVQEDITTFRELKLRLLNGTHSFTCALAILLGCNTVKQAMEHPLCFPFINQLMRESIADCLIKNGLDEILVTEFIDAVQDRFRNPFIDHQWVSITMNYTEKMRMRNIPLIASAIEQEGFVPDTMVYGFAAYLWLNMHAKLSETGVQVADCLDQRFALKDQFAEVLALGEDETISNYLHRVLSNEQIWQQNLLQLNGFATELATVLKALHEQGMHALLHQRMTKALL